MAQFLLISCIFHLEKEREFTAQRVLIAETGQREAEKQKVFLLGFSHELRNLVHSILGNVEICLMEKISRNIAENLENAKMCGELLLHEINNILDSGKVEIGELEVNPKTTNIVQYFNRVWSICSSLITKRGIKGRFIIDKRLPSNVNIDDHRLTQVILNLLSNAVKYTETGYIDLKVEWLPDETKITDEHFIPHPYTQEEEGIFEKDQAVVILGNDFDIRYSNSKRDSLNSIPSLSECGVIRVSVRDTGYGIEQDSLHKIFDKFVQIGDISVKKLGAGLGLYITKTLITKMGGRIQAFSRFGKGTTVIFCLPVKVATLEIQSSQNIIERAPSQTHCPQQLQAMVVDDDYFSLNILSTFMSKLSYRVKREVKTGKDAYFAYKDSYLSGEPIRVITMDINMPEMDGKTAAKMIRAYEKEKGIPPCHIIMVSGNCSESEILECTKPDGEIRASTFLKKPVTLEEMRAVLSNLIEPNNVH